MNIAGTPTLGGNYVSLVVILNFTSHNKNRMKTTNRFVFLHDTDKYQCSTQFNNP